MGSPGSGMQPWARQAAAGHPCWWVEGRSGTELFPTLVKSSCAPSQQAELCTLRATNLEGWVMHPRPGHVAECSSRAKVSQICPH